MDTFYAVQCTTDSCRTFLKDVSTSALTREQKNICKGELTEKEINEALASFASNKSPVKIPNNILDSSPLFYKKILGCWGKYYSQAPKVSLAIGSKYLWFNNFVNIDSKVVYFREFSESSTQ